LPEGDDRAGEGDRADEHAEKDLDGVDRAGGAGEVEPAEPGRRRMPTSTAAAPTKLCRTATSSGIAGHGDARGQTRR
jgi:hypothetical protein